MFTCVCLSAGWCVCFCMPSVYIYTCVCLVCVCVCVWCLVCAYLDTITAAACLVFCIVAFYLEWIHYVLSAQSTNHFLKSSWTPITLLPSWFQNMDLTLSACPTDWTCLTLIRFPDHIVPPSPKDWYEKALWCLLTLHFTSSQIYPLGWHSPRFPSAANLWSWWHH